MPIFPDYVAVLSWLMGAATGGVLVEFALQSQQGMKRTKSNKGTVCIFR